MNSDRVAVATQGSGNEIHNARRNEYEADQHNGESTGLRKLQFRHTFQNAGRDEGPMHGHQENGGTDGGHRVNEEVAHPGQDRREHEGYRHRRKGLDGRRPQAAAGFFDRGVDLRQRCNDVADPRRRITEDVGRDQNVERSGENDGLVVKRDDVGNTHHGAGERVV